MTSYIYGTNGGMNRTLFTSTNIYIYIYIYVHYIHNRFNTIYTMNDAIEMQKEKNNNNMKILYFNLIIILILIQSPIVVEWLTCEQ